MQYAKYTNVQWSFCAVYTIVQWYFMCYNHLKGDFIYGKYKDIKSENRS